MARKTEKTETGMVKYQDRLKALAKRIETAEKVTGGGIPKIEIRSGNFIVDDAPVEGNELEVVVLTAIHANTYYAEEWDPNVISLPVCYAFGDPKSDDPEAEMAPHPEAEEPQHDNCAECPLNQFGSAPRGKGKACKNSRRLAVMLAEELDDPASADVRVLTVSPTNLKGWSAYANLLAKTHGLPPIGVVTRIKIVPDPKNQYKLLFSYVETIEFNDELADALFARADEAEVSLTAPFQKREEEEAPPKRATRRAAAGKAAPARTQVKRTASRGRKF